MNSLSKLPHMLKSYRKCIPRRIRMGWWQPMNRCFSVFKNQNSRGCMLIKNEDSRNLPETWWIPMFGHWAPKMCILTGFLQSWCLCMLKYNYFCKVILLFLFFLCFALLKKKKKKVALTYFQSIVKYQTFRAISIPIWTNILFGTNQN